MAVHRTAAISLLLALVSLSLVPAGLTQPGAAQAPTLEAIGQIGGWSHAVAAQGTYVYMGAGPRLLVLDASEPAHPVVTGRSAILPDVVADVVVSGTHAYLAGGAGGLRILNVADPVHPAEIGVMATGNPQGLALSGDLAYVAATAALQIVDVSDPAHPQPVGAYAAVNAIDVALSGHYAYLVDDARMLVVDVADPADPTLTATYGTILRWPTAIAAYGDLVAIADSDQGLHLVDVSDPLNPNEFSRYHPMGECGGVQGVALAADLAYVACSDGLRVLNVSDPAHPQAIGWAPTPDDLEQVFITGGYAYAVEVNSLHVIDVALPGQPQETGSYLTPGVVRAVDVAGTWAYLVRNSGGLCVVDVADPAEPLMAARLESAGYASSLGVSVADQYAYVSADQNGLYIVDVSDPVAPVEAGHYQFAGRAMDAVVVGDYAYLADGAYAGGLRILDVSDPALPVEAGALLGLDSMWGLAVEGQRAYLTGYYQRQLWILDVSDPAHPSVLGAYAPLQTVPHDVTIVGYTAYLATWSGLEIVDVTNPANPVQVGRFGTWEGAYEVAVSDGYAHIAAGDRLYSVSLWDPRHPLPAGSWDSVGGMYGGAFGVDRAGDLLYVADLHGGLVTLRFTARAPVFLPLVGNGAP